MQHNWSQIDIKYTHNIPNTQRVAPIPWGYNLLWVTVLRWMESTL